MDCANATQRVTGEDLRMVRKEVQSPVVWEQIRGRYQIPEQEVLLEVLLALEERSEGQDYIRFEGKAVQENVLRSLWLDQKAGHSSPKRGLEGQQAGEPADPVSPLSHEIALAAESLFRRYNKTAEPRNRTKRLKALGNAVVPAQAFPFFKAIADIENGVMR